jgi:hypothetical protein
MRLEMIAKDERLRLEMKERDKKQNEQMMQLFREVQTSNEEVVNQFTVLLKLFK